MLKNTWFECVCENDECSKINFVVDCGDDSNGMCVTHFDCWGCGEKSLVEDESAIAWYEEDELYTEQGVENPLHWRD